jgi:dTDP-4-amino-4,6-dideoxygalactose transaminase
MIPYGRQEILEDDIQAVIQALRSNLITTGPLVDEFEERLSSYVGSPTFVVNSGTAALHAAYFGIGIGPGDELITPPNTFIATQATAALLGAKIVFADIDLETGLIDPQEIGKLITKRTKAIVLVDYAGQPCDVEEIRRIIGDRDIKIVQDAAHSLGSKLNGKPVGSQADVTTFSFFATKNITTGEGGAVSSPNKEIFQRAKEFCRQGLVRDPSRFINQPPGSWHQEVHEFGLNYRLTDFQCALGISQLSRIESIKQRRREVYAFYEDSFRNNQKIRRLKVRELCDPMWHLYPIFVQDKERLFENLRSKGIGVQVNYVPAYHHPVFSKLGYEALSLERSEIFYKEELSLPIYSGLTEENLDLITKSVKELV